MKLPQPLDVNSFVYKFKKNFNLKSKQDYFGSSPNVFVGRYKYPFQSIGLMSVENYNLHDDPLVWSSKGFGIDDIVPLRSSLVNSTFSKSSKFLEMTKEVSLASSPVEMEINLTKKPQFNFNSFSDALPHGPRIDLKKAMITSNPKIPQYVEKIVDDDLRAVDSLNILFKKNYDEHYLTKVFSVGNLGLKSGRKLVPTRWSITAVDDTLGKGLISSVKDFKLYDYSAYFGSYLGNYYLILFFPEVWSYELFETYVGGKFGKSAFKSDFEGYSGRSKYALNTVGGYYSARLACLEKLQSLKRQGSVLCLRFITDEYHTHLGVFVCREACRNSLKMKPIGFSSMELMVKYANSLVSKKFGFDLIRILEKSVLFNNLKKQSKLTKYI